MCKLDSNKNKNKLQMSQVLQCLFNGLFQNSEVASKEFGNMLKQRLLEDENIKQALQQENSQNQQQNLINQQGQMNFQLGEQIHKKIHTNTNSGTIYSQEDGTPLNNLDQMSDFNTKGDPMMFNILKDEQHSISSYNGNFIQIQNLISQYSPIYQKQIEENDNRVPTSASQMFNQ